LSDRTIQDNTGELDGSFLSKPFSGVPVFEGGPVEQDKLIVAAWEWLDSPSSFKLYFGIDLEKAESLKKENSSIVVACFLGHSGWSPGQLEEEIEKDSWLVSALNHELFSQMNHKKEIWKKTVGSISDELKLLVDCPENPMNN
jgi:putative transcriptional regulator